MVLQCSRVVPQSYPMATRKPRRGTHRTHNHTPRTIYNPSAAPGWLRVLLSHGRGALCTLRAAVCAHADAVRPSATPQVHPKLPRIGVMAGSGSWQVYPEAAVRWTRAMDAAVAVTMSVPSTTLTAFVPLHICLRTYLSPFVDCAVACCLYI